MAGQLRVDPLALHLTAGQIDGHASDFLTTHQQSHAQAGSVTLGSGTASAAMTPMLEAWDSDGSRLHQRLATLADNHREAATRYTNTDSGSAEGIDNAASAS